MSEMGPDAAMLRGETPGRALASAREALGLSVPEVAARLKYAPRQIEAIESDRYEALPAGPIGRGMIRSYAKLVGIDPAPLLERIGGQLARGPQTVQPPNMDVPFESAPRRGSLLYVMFSIAVFMAVVAVAVEWLYPGARFAPAESPPVAKAPVAAPPPAPASTLAPSAEPALQPRGSPPPAFEGSRAVAESVVDLVFGADCWIEIRDAKNEVLLSQINAPGTHQRIEGIPPLSLVIGNTDGVQVRYNDMDVDLTPHARAGVARLTLK